MKRKTIIISIISAIVLAMLIIPGIYGIRYRYSTDFAHGLSMSLRELKQFYGGLSKKQDQTFGMIVEASRGNWEKVLELIPPDDRTILGSYHYNLANAMLGRLSDSLMYHYQPFGLGLFLPVDEKSSLLMMISSDEVWYQLGDMTMAEHNAIVGMIFSPKQKGPRFYRRLAQINMVNGDSLAAKKYLDLLGEQIPDNWQVKKKLAAQKDFVHGPSDIRPVLQNLIRSNPDNTLAYEYLLCYDLLTKDITSFIEDYRPEGKQCRLYQEAILIHLAAGNSVNPESVRKYNIPMPVLNDFAEYNRIYFEDHGFRDRLEKKFRRSYWYFFQFAKINEHGKRQ